MLLLQNRLLWAIGSFPNSKAAGIAVWGSHCFCQHQGLSLAVSAPEGIGYIFTRGKAKRKGHVGWGEPLTPSSAFSTQPARMWQKEDEEKSYCQGNSHKLTDPRGASCFLIQQSIQFYKEGAIRNRTMHNSQWSKELLTKAISPIYVNIFLTNIYRSLCKLQSEWNMP